MPDFTGIQHIDALLAQSEATDRDGDGNLTYSTFIDGGDRYLFDFELPRPWQQFEAEEDQWYFGCWVNKETMRILTYAEGDLDLTQYKDDESFDKAILAKCRFHAPLASIRTIDFDGTITRYYQDRRELFIDPDRYPLQDRQTWETDENDETNDEKE